MGPPGVSGLAIASASQLIPPTGQYIPVGVACPPGKAALSGGFEMDGYIPNSGEVPVVQDRPSIGLNGLPTGWTVTGFTAVNGVQYSLTVFAVCGFVNP
jgi:hypothetical protein